MLAPVFSTLLFLTVAAALYLGWRRRQWLVAVPAALVLVYSWMPVAMALTRAWEWPYVGRRPAGEDIGAIVVLAAVVHDPFPPMPVPVAGYGTFERCVYAAWLHRHWRPLPVVASGGRLSAGQPAYAETMKRELIGRGVPAEAIWLEDRSRSTWENAVYSAELLRRRGIRRIALVTTAVHMRRAEACFRRQGIEVVPAACRYHSIYWLEPFDWFVPNWLAISWHDELLYEVGGYAWYALRGRI